MLFKKSRINYCDNTIRELLFCLRLCACVRACVRARACHLLRDSYLHKSTFSSECTKCF